MTQYFKILLQAKRGEMRLEFHTGTDRAAVAVGKSLNAAIAVTAEQRRHQAERDARIKELLGEWHAEIKLYGLKPA